MKENSSKNIIFVVTEMRLGGREKVVGRIADGVSDYYNKVQIYSVWNRSPYFFTKVPIIFKHDLTWKPRSGTNLRGVTNNKIYRLIKECALFFAKWLFNYSFLQRKGLNELISIIKDENIDTVVLTDLTTTFSKELKKECPHVKVISWLHMEPRALFHNQYLSFQRELKNGLASVDELVALTDNQKKSYSKYHQNVHTISNPMPDIVYQRLNPKVEHNGTELLIVSRIDIEHKGLDTLVDILASMNFNWHLTLIGSGDVRDEAKFKKLIEDRGIKDKISLLGAKQGIELKNYYKQGSIFLMTSRFEGFPMSIGEAMANGLPIVSFALDGVKEATGIKNYSCQSDANVPAILVSPGDNINFARSVKKLLNNPEQQMNMSCASIKRAKQFSIEHITEEWKKIL